MFPRTVIVGALVGALSLISSARSADVPDTKIWSMKPNRVFFTAKSTIYEGRDLRFSCRFLSDRTIDESTPVTFCASDKAPFTGNAQILTRDVDGVLQAISITADLRGVESNTLATQIDLMFYMYLVGKVDDDKILDKAKTARRRLMEDLQRQSRVVYGRKDATITGYVDGAMFHLDFDRPAITESDE